MFYVGLSKAPPRDAIEAALIRHAPEAHVHWCLLDEYEHEDIAGAIFLNLSENASEFGYMLGAQNMAGYDDYRLGMDLARELSIALHCRTVCDGTNDDPSPNPGSCVVWDEGRPFLGNDYSSLFYDDSPELSAEERADLGPIRILRPLDLQRPA